MAWAKPQNNRGRVDAAGDALLHPPISSDEYEAALSVINNWRSSHGYPLQCLKMVLLGRAKSIDSKALIAQRLKRLHSIELKLKNNPHMKLSQMQDLGGCRAVVRSVHNVHQLVSLYEQSNAKISKRGAEFVKKYDYIQNPKESGYRSVHLVYKYHTASKDRAIYNGLRIEIQLRSRLQHAWATAVETASIFTGQALKSNIGADEWLRFFALMGSAIALQERGQIVPNTPTDRKILIDEISDLAHRLKVETILESWVAAQSITAKTTNAYAFLLVLDPVQKTISVTPFTKKAFPKASEQYLLVEKETADKPGVQAVLVSVSSLQALRSAYPNFYLDTKVFLETLRQVIIKRPV